MPRVEIPPSGPAERDGLNKIRKEQGGDQEKKEPPRAEIQIGDKPGKAPPGEQEKQEDRVIVDIYDKGDIYNGNQL
jgi:hypothetical protein